MKITSETVCIGKTPGKRAVWQNDDSGPFISTHDANEVQHLILVDASQFERIKKPYTRGSLDV